MKYNKKILILIIALLMVLVACTKKKTIFDKVFDSINIVSETSESIQLPSSTDLAEDANFYWTSNESSVIGHDGYFIRPDYDVKVTLTLLLTIDRESQLKEFVVTAKGWESQKIDNEEFKSPGGFASLGVTNRANLASKVLIANDEIEFLQHMIDTEGKKDVVIKITKDLNMGDLNVGRLLIERGLWDGVDPKKSDHLKGKVYRANTNRPTLHPTLLQEGIGQLIIDGRDGLMIYSDTGVTIKHLTTHIKGGSKNIVIRNLKLQGIWEWDEIDRGDYKALDWDHFTIEQAENIWLDHLTFKTSYDGLVDVKGGTKNITLSWLNLDFDVDEYIKIQFDWLEANQDRVPFYRELRQDVSRENIEIIAAGQKKGFNFGNTEGGPGFETITITLHNIYARNLQDRFPRLRRGDVHVYNVVLDSSELQELKDDRMKVISQGMVPTEQGALLMENSRFVGVNEPIKTHQSSNLNEDFTGRFKVVNSQYINKTDYYVGSSDDRNYENPWVKSNNNVLGNLEFYFRNYQTVPYEYKMTDPEKLTKKFDDNLTGAGEIEGFNWLEIKKLIDPNTIDKGMKINEDRIEGLDRHLATLNSEFKMFIPTVYNYYTGEKLVLDRDYSFSLDSTNVKVDEEGSYEAIYYIYLIGQEEKLIEYRQTYIVYNKDAANEIYDNDINRPFDNILFGTVYVYMPNGKIYYYLSTDANADANYIIENGVEIDITNTKVDFGNIIVGDNTYIHFATVINNIESEPYNHKIEMEIIVEVSTFEEFNNMLVSNNTKGRYYKLMNDLDFTEDSEYTTKLWRLTADNVFEGVFDGQGFTISNLNRHGYGGGIFHTITDGKIKNITFDNIIVTIKQTIVIDFDTGEEVGVTKTSARSGIVAGQIKGGQGILENITIKNSEVRSDNNYAAILVGKVEGYSELIARNITVLNSKVIQDGEYVGGLIAGIETNTKSLIEDVYINGLVIKEGKEKMAGVIVGRMSLGITINRVVILNVDVTTNVASGGIFGKDDRKTAQEDIILNDIFVNYHNNVNHIQYVGNIVGNPDASATHPPIIMNNIWGTAVETGSSGISTGVEFTVILDDLDTTWWESNFASLLESGNWEISDGMIKLK